MDRPLRVTPLSARKLSVARAAVRLLARVFETPGRRPKDAWLQSVLRRPDFFGFAAVEGEAVVGALTGFVLPLTQRARVELFVYDVAVDARRRRRGVGRALMDAVRAKARVLDAACVFVLADDEDTHALDFYRALGGAGAKVTAFTFRPGRAAPRSTRSGRQSG